MLTPIRKSTLTRGRYAYHLRACKRLDTIEWRSWILFKRRSRMTSLAPASLHSETLTVIVKIEGITITVTVDPLQTLSEFRRFVVRVSREEGLAAELRSSDVVGILFAGEDLLLAPECSLQEHGLEDDATVFVDLRQEPMKLNNHNHCNTSVSIKSHCTVNTKTANYVGPDLLSCTQFLLHLTLFIWEESMSARHQEMEKRLKQLNENNGTSLHSAAVNDDVRQMQQLLDPELPGLT